MGKVSPKDRGRRIPKQGRQLRSTGNRYLKPGTLARRRYKKPSTGRSYTDIGKEIAAILHSRKTYNSVEAEDKVLNKIPLMLSPVNLVKQNNLLGSPRTPRPGDFQSESMLESLPKDLLAKILCHLQHDQLEVVFHVSQRIRNAALIAREIHFNYTTPERSRQGLPSTITPRPPEQSPFLCPNAPKASRHGPRPPSPLKFPQMRQVAAVLFQESDLPSLCMVPSVLPKPLCKSLPSNLSSVL